MSRIFSLYPYLSIGANFHHERYDGTGYPNKLKGTDIPEIARIISVADAYDAMTSSRSYRDPIPQQNVREEIVRCAGTQFDPKFANIMIHLIDQDTKYKMKEKDVINQPTIDDELVITEHGYDCEIVFERDGNRIVAVTDNAGISIKSTTDIKVPVDKIYVALSGDQCAITNIRIYS